MMKHHLTIWAILPFLSLIINAVLPSAAIATKVTTSIIEEYSNGRNHQSRRALKRAKTVSAAEIETRCFTKKGKKKEYWIVKNDDHDALVEATGKLINSKGKWQGESKCPTYVKYRGPLDIDDFKYIEKWLKLKNLNYFSIAGQQKSANFDMVMEWYERLIGQEENIESGDIYKLIWLNWSSALHNMGQGECGLIPEEWINKHLTYHENACLYKEYKKAQRKQLNPL
jgi:hypothetical protein